MVTTATLGGNSIKILVMVIIIGWCFYSISLKRVEYGNTCLLILIAASIYLGVVYEKNKEKDDKGLGDKIPDPSSNIPKEFLDEQDKFKRSNERIILG